MATKRSTDLHLRLRPRELSAWKAAAKIADETLSEWIRVRCNYHAKQKATKTP